MGRVLVVLALLVTGWWLLNVARVDPGRGPGAGRFQVRVEGREVIVTTDDLEARFRRAERLDEAFMVFGGNREQPRNSITHATLAGLGLAEARSIHRDHPDFHRCDSPGAARAKPWVETWSFVAADGSARTRLADAVDRHAEALREDGERTCVQVHGARLELESLRLAPEGRDVTGELAPAFARTRLALAEQVSLPECRALLR